jgi:hypothetical protein
MLDIASNGMLPTFNNNNNNNNNNKQQRRKTCLACVIFQSGFEFVLATRVPRPPRPSPASAPIRSAASAAPGCYFPNSHAEE